MKSGWIIIKVFHFFSLLNFPTIKFQLFCFVWAILMLTSNVSSQTPVCHRNIRNNMIAGKSTNQVKCYNANNIFYVHFVVITNLWWFESTSIFCTNDVMCHTLWCHLSPLSYQFSIFEDMGGWQPWIPNFKHKHYLYNTGTSQSQTVVLTVPKIPSIIENLPSI